MIQSCVKTTWHLGDVLYPNHSIIISRDDALEQFLRLKEIADAIFLSGSLGLPD
jgi:hypothetical protein